MQRAVQIHPLRTSAPCDLTPNQPAPPTNQTLSAVFNTLTMQKTFFFFFLRSLNLPANEMRHISSTIPERTAGNSAVVRVTPRNYRRLLSVRPIEGKRFGRRAAAAVVAAGGADYILITPHVSGCCSALTAIFKSFAGIFYSKVPVELSKKLNGVSGRVRNGNNHEKTLPGSANPVNPGPSFVALIKMKAML